MTIEGGKEMDDKEKNGGNATNKGYYEIIREWSDGGRRFRRIRLMYKPVGETKPHPVEITEEEIRVEGETQVWQKVFGSEKDPAS